MQQAKGVNTLIVKQNFLVHVSKQYQVNSSIITWYQQAVSSLIYTIIETGFDIAYTVSIISQFVNNPISKHVTARK